MNVSFTSINIPSNTLAVRKVQNPNFLQNVFICSMLLLRCRNLMDTLQHKHLVVELLSFKFRVEGCSDRNETSLRDFLNKLIAFVVIILFDLFIKSKLPKGDDEY